MVAQRHPGGAGRALAIALDWAAQVPILRPLLRRAVV